MGHGPSLPVYAPPAEQPLGGAWPPRRGQLFALDDGATRSAVLRIGDIQGDNPFGWLLCFKVAPSSGQDIVGRLDVLDVWEGEQIGNGVRYDEWQLSQGGLVWVPHAVFEVSCIDRLAAGAGDEAIVQVNARPVCAGMPVGAGRTLFGWGAPTVIGAAATVNYPIPDGATGYRVNFVIVGGTTHLALLVTVQSFDTGGTQTFGATIVDPMETTVNGELGPSGWQSCPPGIAQQAAEGRRLVINNSDQVNAITAVVQFRYVLGEVV